MKISNIKAHSMTTLGHKWSYKQEEMVIKAGEKKWIKYKSNQFDFLIQFGVFTHKFY